MKVLNLFISIKSIYYPCIKRAGFFIGLQKNRPRNIVFKVGLFQNRYNHKGQVKFSSYAQYMSVFEKPSKPLIIRDTTFQ